MGLIQDQRGRSQNLQCLLARHIIRGPELRQVAVNVYLFQAQ